MGWILCSYVLLCRPKNFHFLITYVLNLPVQVAVRTSESDPHWYRGRIMSLMRRPDANGRVVTYVGVFLVDYGRFIDNIAATAGATNVRELPPEMQDRPKHLAFAVKLAGLRPQEMDIKYDTGMKRLSSVVADKWSPAAMSYIKVGDDFT